MTTTKYDIIIIGGGISGLSLAYSLAEMGQKVLILERSNRVGGAIERLTHDGFSIDLGAHTGYNSYTNLLEIISQNPVHQELQERTKQKYYFASPTGFQKLTKPLQFGALLWHLHRAFSAKKEGKTVKAYYSKILGNKNYTNFARHFFKAVLCQSADNYPAAFFLKRRDSRNKSYPRSFTFKNGMQALTDALQKHANVEILLSQSVTHIEKRDSFEVVTNESNYHSDSLAFACYATEASQLLSPIAPKLSTLLSKIQYQTVSSLGIIVKKETVAELKEFAGLLTTTDHFTSIVSRDIAPNKNYRGFTIHAQGQVSAEFLKNKLCDALKIKEDSVLKEQYKNNYLPQLKKGHEYFLEEMIENISQTENIYITGNYFQGLSLEDCVQRSQEEALRYISTQK